MTVAGTPPSTSAADRAASPGLELLDRVDPRLADIVRAEEERQRTRLQLLAGESFTSPAVLAVLGSVLTDKYAEGYPGARYHAGCEIVDLAEQLAVERATALFGAEHANVQPYSGSSANLAAYAALLVPGDTVLAMGLPEGGHLTHGSRANFSGRWFDFVGYGVHPRTGLVDMDRVRELALAHRPKAIVCGAISYPRHLDHAAFREIADEVGAYLVVDAAHTLGLVAGGAAPDPVPYADVVTGTTHKLLRGPRGGLILCGAQLARRIDRAVFPFSQGGPHMNVVAAKAVAFAEAATPAFARYARQVVANARTLASGLAGQGLALRTGGTDTHLMVAGVTGLGLDGQQARARCAGAGIVVDKCAVPGDPRPPSAGSAIRLGTASVTCQGMGEDEAALIADLIGRALRGARGVAAEVADLTARFPPRPGQA
ncbi:serine hydroxymethyltransferase [Streptomyces sp. NPDC059506]|uniref:serine hydroxymethyltransferase n=1 Tax=Streptomyces TaxID=1883 RepID=UPI0015FDEACE|nr:MULTISPECIES: serine hydroxymethyltransferase [unclassified Streptomyces]MCZ2524242.1 serine hydroxymethyltransferase [Streptomyces sp. HB2AG]QMV21734.1 serine hydroxymethyltransferase [Streptomyces sp. SCUT-3]